MGSAMRRILGTILLCGMVVLLISCPAVAKPRVMSDTELDEVSASGGFDIEVNTGTDGSSSLSFTFDMGATTGFGNVSTTPVVPSTPSGMNFTGAVDMTGALFNVENMIFNLNICVQCQGNIIQTGIGIPISIKTSQ